MSEKDENFASWILDVITSDEPITDEIAEEHTRRYFEGTAPDEAANYTLKEST